MTKINFTSKQNAAIDSRGGNILVSAAAGSGKTAVLSQRVINRLLFDNPPVSADSLMIVTFTNASASEMKMRITKKLTEYIEENPDNTRAREQLNLLPRAKIGTIHSVCMELLKQNFNTAGLPADFKLGSPEEIKLLKNKCAAAVLEKAYCENDDIFMNLAELLGDKKSDEKFLDTILKILEFATAVPFYHNWFNEKLEAYNDFSEPSESIWGKIIFQRALSSCEACLFLIDEIEKTIEENPEIETYQVACDEDRRMLLDFKKAILSKDFDLCFSKSKSLSLTRLKAAKGAGEEIKNSVKSMREIIKKNLKKFNTNLFITDTKGFHEDIDDLFPKIKRLFELIKETDQLIRKQKLEDKIIDFSDLEQLSLKLLVTLENGKFKKTPLAEELSSTYSEIMIDEYQDVNATQDTILKTLSNGNNRFMVGDIKQSIYRFRQAKPQLFQDMLLNFNSEESGLYPRKILLNGNFRTRKQLTEIINTIFKNIMSEELGEVSYDNGQQLEPMSTYPPKDESSFSFMLIENDINGQNSTVQESQVVAKKIKELLQSGEKISDNGILRPINAGDIAILLRSPKSKAGIYKKALSKENITAVSSTTADFLTSQEILSVFNLLSAIENPTKNIELAGAMISPIFGFSDDDLAWLTLNYPENNLYSSLCKCESNSELGKFKDYFDTLRSFSKANSVPDLILKIYHDTDFFIIAKAMENGEQRQANLNLFLEYTYDYQNRGYNSLSRFIRILKNIYSQKQQLPPAVITDAKNSVTITSVHRSKGLEWPVVFLCETSKKHSFYQNDMKESYILNDSLGFACVRRDKKLKCQYNTVPLVALKAINEQQSLSEEMRILYVAMTRAKEKLIFSATVSNTMKKLSEFRNMSNSPYPPQLVAGYHCFCDWILMGLLKDNLNEHELIEVLDSNYLKEDDEIPQTTDLKSADPQLLSEIKKRLEYNYPLQKASQIPMKIAASKLSGNLKTAFAFSKKPDFNQNKKSGTQKGNAFHKFMQICNFHNASSNPKKEIERLFAKNLLSENEVSLLSPTAISAIFLTQMGKLMLSADTLLREHRFFAPASCSTLASDLCDGEGNYAILEGVTDLIIIKNDKLYVVDYKTDNVADENELALRYRPQVLLYRDMLKANFSLPVEGCYIYSFKLNKEILL